jgi:hypothetical protein
MPQKGYTVLRSLFGCFRAKSANPCTGCSLRVALVAWIPTGGADSFRLHELVIIVDQSLAVAHAWLINLEHHSSPWPNPREPV